MLEDLGGISPASLGVILRAIVTIEQDGADVFFGEPEFDVDDLLRTTADGKGIVTLLEVADVMDRPRLYSTFVLWMLAQLYEGLPEIGDLPKPKLAFFFDEAHLLFKDASQALLDQIERTARLIRSKGVGVYFVTQAPTDVPSPVLSQLGNRIQHALRAFTPDDADALRKTARTFPVTTHYDVERTITSLGIGEALVTVLSPKGVPTPLAATRLIPPDSRMAPLTDPRSRRSSPPRRWPPEVRRRPSTGRAPTRSSPPGWPTPAPPRRPPRPRPRCAAGRRRRRPPGLGTMTAAQQQREIERQARELREGAGGGRARAQGPGARGARGPAPARDRMVETGIRTAGRVVTSRAGPVADPRACSTRSSGAASAADRRRAASPPGGRPARPGTTS